MKQHFSRRDFIKNGCLGLMGGVMLGGLLSSSKNGIYQDNIVLAETSPSGLTSTRRQWRFIVNIKKCIGCGFCVKACKQENDVPLLPEYNRTWIERYIITKNEDFIVDSPDGGINGFANDNKNGTQNSSDVLKTFFVPKLCNQCNKPPCVQVCPVGATYRTEDGIVLINKKACIGCRYCIQACPYGARYFNAETRIVDKCTWCYHRISHNLPPACVEVCPVGARMFGDVSDPASPVASLLKDEVISILKPQVGSRPMVYYIGMEKGVS